MTLSIFATQTSPAVGSPSATPAEAGAEPSQSFSSVLQQEGQQDGASQTDVVNSDQVTGDEVIVDAAELPVVSDEAVTALVSALLGAMPALPEALPDETAPISDSTVTDELAGGVGVVATLLSPTLFNLSPGLNPANSANAAAGSTTGATAGASQPGMAVAESQLLPPGGNALPAWSMLLNGAPTGTTDPNATTASATNDPAAAADVELSAALAGSADNKTFQTLLRSDPMLTGLATGAGNALDNFSGSANGSLVDASLPAIVDTSRLGTSSTATPANPTSTELAPGLPLRSPAFGTLLANQVLWQAKVGNNEAAIRLDPPELGPIDVRISQVDNETHLHFTAGHGLTRDQLEQAIPRLRELFSQGGLSLGQVLVEQGSRDNASQRDGSDGNQNSAKSRNTANETMPTSVRLLNGLIDDYA